MNKTPDTNTEDKLRSEAAQAAPVMTAEEQIEHAIERRPKKWLTIIVRYLLPVALTVLLLWYLFSKVDFSGMMDILKQGVDYWWILLAMGISIFSHVFRAIRWRLQLRTMGINPPLMAVTCSIFGCYALNLVFPRIGEVWRCTYISKREKAPFTTVLGSMVSDRLSDTVSVFLLLVLTLIVANRAIMDFLHKYPVGQDIISLVENPLFWVAVVAGIILIVALFWFGRSWKAVRKIRKWLKEMWIGFSTVWQMKGRWKFVLLTIGIWGCFFIQLYVAFFAFGFTRALCGEPGLAYGFVPCLVAFVLSSIGMAIPSNGGLGPWNIAIMFGLAVYGISDTQGTAFSMVQWTGETIMLILLGLFTVVYVTTWGKRKKNSV